MDEREGVPVKVKVHDKRRSDSPGEPAEDVLQGVDESPAGEAPPMGRDMPAPAAEPEADAVVVDEEMRDYLDDLRRLQAEFENYRKRMMKEQASVGSRASARLVERLLPVLDNFERAIAHGEGGEGVRLVFKQLADTLAAEGLEEIAAEGAPFDPTLHEAVGSEEDAQVSEPVVRQVFRRGYVMGGQLLRPAMVVVARPPDATVGAEASPEEEPGDGEVTEGTGAEG